MANSMQIILVATLCALSYASGQLVTFDEFVKATTSGDYPAPTNIQYDAFSQGLEKGLITGKEEAAMALTQFLHESDGLRAKEEYKCKDTGCPGEYVTGGCDAPNKHYYGRGYIQITWCDNYKAASQSLYQDDRFVSDPDSVASNENYSWDSAFWFWKVNVHSAPGVSEGQFGATTRAINGALECDAVSGQSIARERYALYGKVRGAFGLDGPGSEQGCY